MITVALAGCSGGHTAEGPPSTVSEMVPAPGAALTPGGALAQTHSAPEQTDVAVRHSDQPNSPPTNELPFEREIVAAIGYDVASPNAAGTCPTLQ